MNTTGLNALVTELYPICNPLNPLLNHQFPHLNHHKLGLNQVNPVEQNNGFNGFNFCHPWPQGAETKKAASEVSPRLGSPGLVQIQGLEQAAIANSYAL